MVFRVKPRLTDRLMIEKYLTIVAWLVCAVLLFQFAVGFTAEGPLLAVPFWGLAALTLAVMAVSAIASPVSRPPAQFNGPDRLMRGLLLLSIPVAFLVSSLDCTGLSLHGCSTFCTFIKLIWIPVVAIVCVACYRTSSRSGQTVLLLMSFVPLFPHCGCYNPANAWWIDHIGASPDCYIWGFAVSALTLGALRTGRRYLITGSISAAIIAGSLAFFISHHYLGFPW